MTKVVYRCKVGNRNFQLALYPLMSVFVYEKGYIPLLEFT